MKSIITLEHKKALFFFLTIFALAAMLFFSSCSVAQREGDTSPCYSSKHYIGYGPGGFGRGQMKP